MKLLFYNNNTVSKEELENLKTKTNTIGNNVKINIFLKKSHRNCSKPMIFNGKKTCSSCSGK